MAKQSNTVVLSRTMPNPPSSGNGNGVPVGFDKLSKKNQSELIKSTLQDIHTDIVNKADNIVTSQALAKRLTGVIKRSKTGNELAESKVRIKRDKSDLNSLVSERKGILRLARKLGLDVGKDVKALKQLNC